MNYFGVISAVVVAWALVCFVVFGKLWRRPGAARRFFQRLAVFLGALLVVHALFDVAFATFVVRSDGYGHTLAAKRWFQRYWNPINAQGFRDGEHPEAELEGKRLVLVVGDSFVAGHGIEEVSERFGDRLGEELGDGFRTVILAQNGWNTVKQARAVRSFSEGGSRSPEIVVLSYYLNDIDGAGKETGRPRPAKLLQPPPRMLAPYIDSSPLGNEIYWRYYRLRRGGESTYLDYLIDCYDDPETWRVHAAQLDDFIASSRESGARLVVVIFPFLLDVKSSQRLTARVAQHFEQRGVDVVDLGQELAGRSPSSLVVNACDAHPDVELHAEVAGLLLGQIVLAASEPND